MKLGHADIETTSNTYAHLIKELRERDETETVNIFEDRLLRKLKSLKKLRMCMCKECAKPFQIITFSIQFFKKS
ncbi:integrase [Bacillus licheniformis]|nr:putative integrase [Bacillus licheniformis DSM 13 = ATCC 14580]APJ26127.1 integrase [Bacillus sp. H15-1]ASV14474.1 integrase [Bacillus sp. 1s-1]ATI75152.1 integrase [Bacillus licheniformis]MBY8349440.1 integrase [Bacillus sp. PCH94]